MDDGRGFNNQSLIEQARKADLIKYLEMNGYNIEKSGSGNFRLADRKSLIATTNMFYDFNDPQMKGNTLDFLIKYEGKKFKDAVETLTNSKFMSYEASNNAVKYERNTQKETTESKDVNLPAKNNTSTRVFAYLNKTRKIDKDIIADMMKRGLIYESDRHNCVFLGKDAEGKVKYAAERGTLSSVQFRKESQGSDKNFGFSMEGKSNKVYAFEAPIEALSHATISKLDGNNYKQDHRVSLGGTEPKALMQYLKDKPNINEVTLCLNNDDAGKKGSQRIAEMLEEKGYKVTQDSPILKDYNEDLITMSKKLEMVMG